MRKKSAVGADRRTMCVLRYRAAARAPLLHVGGTHGHPLSAGTVQEQRSSCPLVPFLLWKSALLALPVNASVTANAMLVKDVGRERGPHAQESCVCDR